MRVDSAIRHPKKILVIRRDNIGDLVCTTPGFSALRNRFPEAKIAALVNTYNAEVLRGNPNIDRLFVYEKAKHSASNLGRVLNVFRRVLLILELRRWKPDITILAKSCYDRHALRFARQISAKNIIGFAPEGFDKSKDRPDFQLFSSGLTSLHEVEMIGQLLILLGINKPLGFLQVFPDAKVVEKIKLMIPTATSRIALHISAREPARRWGAANFISFVHHVLDVYPNKQILLIWSPGEGSDPFHPGDDELAEYIVNNIKNNQLVQVKTNSLTELIATLSLCDIFVGADGGAMHLAAALNIKIIALFENSPSKLSHWYPWHAKAKLVFSHDEKKPYISEIKPQQVYDAFQSLAE